jgi:hypothetical protein
VATDALEQRVNLYATPEGQEYGVDEETRQKIIDYFISEGIEAKIGRHKAMLNLKYKGTKFMFYWTTSRWGVYNKKTGKEPSKFYWSSGAIDLSKRFIKKERAV